MKTEIYTVDTLTGQTSNPVEGVQGVDRVTNLYFDRAGGYTPFGVAANGTSGATTIESLVGYDHQGLLSYTETASGDTTLFVLDAQANGDIDLNTGPSGTTNDVTISHVPGVGPYRDRTFWYAKDEAGTYRSSTTVYSVVDTIADAILEPTAEPGTGVDLWSVAAGADTAANVVVVTAGSGVGYYTPATSGNDPGPDWDNSIAEFGTFSGPAEVVYDSGLGLFIAAGENGTTISVLTSSDGRTWATATAITPSSGADRVGGIAVDPQTGTIVVGAADPGAGGTAHAWYYSTDTATTWSISQVEISGSTTSHVVYDVIWGNGEFVSTAGPSGGLSLWTIPDPSIGSWVEEQAGAFGRIGYSPDEGTYIVPSTSGSGRYYFGTDPGALTLKSSPGSITPRAAFYGQGRYWLSNTSDEVYTSPDGIAWTLQDLSAVRGSSATRVEHYAEDSNDVVYIVGQNPSGTDELMVYVTGDPLPAGEYYFAIFQVLETTAGGLVRKVDTYDLTSTGAEAVTFQAPTMPDTYRLDIYAYFSDTATENPQYFLLRALRSEESYTIPRTVTEIVGDVLGSNGGVNFGKGFSTDPRPHLRRLYWVIGLDSDYTTFNTTVNLGRQGEGFTIAYSELGYLNMAAPGNYLRVDETQSTSITDLSSGPGQNLYVFLENEIFTVYGDPAFAQDTRVENFGIRRISEGIGHNGTSKVAKLGGLLFCIHNGEIYAITSPQNPPERISAPVFDPEDPFTHVFGDPANNHLVAYRSTGGYMRFSMKHQQWFSDNQLAEPPTYFLPDVEQVVVHKTDGTTNFVTDADGTQVVSFGFDGLDLGDKTRHKLWRRAIVHTSPDYSGTATLTYTVRGTSGAVTGSDQGEGRIVYTFPRGLVAPTADLTFSFTGMLRADSIEPPFVVEYVPRYRER